MSKKEWKDIWFLIQDFTKNNKSMTISMFVFALVNAVYPFISIVLSGLLIDAVYQGAESVLLLRLALYGAGTAAFVRLISVFSERTFNRKLEYMYENQNFSLNRKSMAFDYEYLEDTKVQGLRRNILNAGSSFGLIGSIYSVCERMLENAFTVICAFMIAMPMFVQKTEKEYGFIGTWYCTLLMFLCVGLLIWCDYKYVLNSNHKLKESKDRISPAVNREFFYLNLLSGSEPQKDLRIFCHRNTVEREMREAQEQIWEGMNRIIAINQKRNYVAETVASLSGLSVYWLSGIRAYVGMITIGSVVTYAGSILKLTNGVSEFMRRLGYLKECAMYAADYREYMSLSKRKYDGCIPVEKRQDGRFEVEFSHVSFQYPGSNTYVIKDLNLKFVIGEKMAIVGKNGSGKSTFIKLLCRLYDVTEGCIKINGIDIRNYNYQEYCELFAVVFQDFQMFDFPLGENIAATNAEHVDTGRVLEALKKAGLEERVSKLDRGLDTYVGKSYDEGGVNFSGGEKQKMAIARAIYKDAPFVIMDEPTAALDPISECEVFAGFDKMVGQKTAIYISHRLASCRFCEDILVFDNGQVVQRGSHEKLEKEEGIYKTLWHAQAQYYQG